MGSKCKACGQEILWITTTKEKKMPVNPALISFSCGPGPETFVTQGGKVERGKRDANGTAVGYISHFATCPEADKLRNGGPSNGCRNERNH